MLKTFALIMAVIVAALTPIQSNDGGGYPGPAAVATDAPAPPDDTPMPAPSATPAGVYECVYTIVAPDGVETCGGWWYWGDGTPVPPTPTPRPMAYP